MRCSGWSAPDAVAVNRPGPRRGRFAWPHRALGLPGDGRGAAGSATTADGYGPRGRGFHAHVDVPPEVEAAYAALLAAHPDWGRPAR